MLYYPNTDIEVRIGDHVLRQLPANKKQLLGYDGATAVVERVDSRYNIILDFDNQSYSRKYVSHLEYLVFISRPENEVLFDNAELKSLFD